MLILAFLLRLILNPTEVVAMHYAKCQIITRPVGPDTVAVKWVCPD